MIIWKSTNELNCIFTLKKYRNNGRIKQNRKGNYSAFERWK